MTLSVTIPVWLMWVLGVPIGLFLLLALIVGLFFIFNPPFIWR